MKKIKVGISALAILMIGGVGLSINGKKAYAYEQQATTSITLPNSSEQAVKNYILKNLKSKYGKDFSIVGQFKYQLDGTILKTASASVAPIDNAEDSSTVFIRANGLMEDTYHVKLFENQLTKLFSSVLPSGNSIEKASVDFWGYPSSTGWTGKESIEKYIAAEEYDARMGIQLSSGKNDSEYVTAIFKMVSFLLASNYNITLTVTTDATTLYSQNLTELNQQTFSVEEVLTQIQDYKESTELDNEEENEVSEDENWIFDSEEEVMKDEDWSFAFEETNDANWSYDDVSW